MQQLPSEQDHIHDVLHVSMLRRYHSGPSHVISIEDVGVRLDLAYEEESI